MVEILHRFCRCVLQHVTEGHKKLAAVYQPQVVEQQTARSLSGKTMMMMMMMMMQKFFCLIVHASYL